ncbi:RNA polymerase subunit sigma [Streptomyces globisporus C-1027]|uniref:RNA polymerase subunit sigma n=1 Tax=Streptomyces globisporus C-1027 TaxID=1172567 RepID=A0A0U3LEB1_STRGL|nr:zf-HC2 domain-containing protein [Streptomyces globisporus]ALU94120.1 RNA polymerase subunit sigma [Streptomyces globisporus C-1027]
MSDQQWQPFGPRPPGHRTPSGPSSPPYAAGPAHPSGPAHLAGVPAPPGPPGPFGAGPGPGPGPTGSEGSEHDAAAAYVLGILDDAQASDFEAHLAGCARCAAHLDEFAGMEPMLAMLAEAPSVVPGARPVPHVPEKPAPRLLGGLMDEVARRRHRRSRRSRYWVAAAAALIVGGPVAAFAVTAGDDRGGGPVAVGEPHPTSPAEDAFFEHMTEKVSATDPTTRVGASVGMEEKAWGTHTVLELKNVKGPQKCTLVAVSKTGEEEIVTSWSVPQWGYGIEGATNPAAKAPLYVHGGAAMDREDIARFEVRTFDGERLVEIGA